jgi:hypothetical protein
MGISSGIVGGIGALAGLFGGSNNMPTPPASFQMPNMGGAASNLFSGIQSLQPFVNMGQNSVGQGQNIFSMLQNNPYGNMFLGGANTAAGLGMGQALGQYGVGQNITGMGGQMAGIGGNLVGLGQSAMAPANAVLNTAFDPQSQLYNYLQNQNLQQSQAIEAGAGLATTPYGAGVSALSNQQFNLNWQNQQLARQVQGLGAYTGTLGQAGSLINSGGGLIGAGANTMGAGQQLAAAAPGQYYTSAGLPYGTYNQLGNDQYSNLSQLLNMGASGSNLANLQNTGYSNYLQLGNNANSVANQLYGLQLQAQNQQFQQTMLLGSMLGGSMYRMGSGTSSNSPLWLGSGGILSS